MATDRMADCHPEKKHYCKGMCKTCYARTYTAHKRATDPAWYERQLAAQKRVRDKNGPEYRFNRWLIHTYGITLDDYYAMLKSQHGRCAVCRTRKPRHGKMFFSVDHDHDTGAIRGLLCDGCNIAAGKMKDDPVLLRRLADYIEAGGYDY